MVKLYLISNYHDVSWGSRAANKLKGISFVKKYRLISLLLLIVWILFNGLIIFLIAFFLYNLEFLLALGVLVLIWIGVRSI